MKASKTLSKSNTRLKHLTEAWKLGQITTREFRQRWVTESVRAREPIEAHNLAH